MQIDRKHLYVLTLGLLLICPPLQAAEFQGYRVTLHMRGENGRDEGSVTRELREVCSGWELREAATSIFYNRDGTTETSQRREESFESQNGLSYRFTFTETEGGQETTTAGQAERQRTGDPWRMTLTRSVSGRPMPAETRQLPHDALFQVGYEHAMLRAFAAGRTEFTATSVDIDTSVVPGYTARLYADQRPAEAPAQPAMRSWRVEYISPDLPRNLIPDMGRRYGEKGILLGQWMTVMGQARASELAEFAILPRDCPGS